ncbi:MAG: transporter [Rhodospirillales bacterium]|nr:transporter [Rhodospirillales bacterium]
MGSFATALQMVPLITQGVGLVSDIVSGESSYRDQQKQQELALRQLQQDQRESQRQAQENAILQKEQIAAETKKAEDARRAALKRAVARQRASFGASGIGNQANGSVEAVLLGMFEESDDERANRERLDALRTAALDQNLDQQKRLDVIQLSQLREKQKIGSVTSSIDRYSNLTGSVLGALG